MNIKLSRWELRIGNTEDNFADGKIYAVTFNNIINRYKGIITSSKAKEKMSKDNCWEYTQYLKKGINLLANMEKFYSKAEILIKRKLQGLTFNSKVFVDV